MYSKERQKAQLMGQIVQVVPGKGKNSETFGRLQKLLRVKQKDEGKGHLFKWLFVHEIQYTFVCWPEEFKGNVKNTLCLNDESAIN